MTDKVELIVNVTEKRAPTDESVRLLKEMEQAAQAKISQSVRVENSPIDCVIYRSTDMMNDEIKYAFRMKINGRDLDCKVSIGTHLTREDAIDKVVRTVSESIAAEILHKPFTASLSKFSDFTV